MLRRRLWPVIAGLALAVCWVVVVLRRGDYIGADADDYILAAKDLTGPSRFPPGLPLILAPFAESARVMQAIALAFTLGLVTVIWWGAVKVAGARAGVAAVVLMVLSPGITSDGAQVMSDKPAAFLIVAAFVAVAHERHLLAAILTVWSGWMRLLHVVFVAALPRKAWLPAIVGVCALVAWQLGVKGSLFGYSTGEASFAPRYIFGGTVFEVGDNPSGVINLSFFPGVLTVAGALIPPLTFVPAIYGLRRHWRNPPGRFALAVITLNVLAYLPYFAQSVRFMLPAGCLLVIYAASMVGVHRPTDEGTPARLVDGMCPK